jgi:hypothetical protein
MDKRDLGAFIPSTLDDYGLDPFEFRLYAHLVRRAGAGGACWESIKGVSLCCCMDQKTVAAKLQSLETRNLINVERRAGFTSLITLTPTAQWQEPQPKTPKPKNGLTQKQPTPETDHLPPQRRIDPPPRNGVGGDPETDHKGTPSKEIPLRNSQEGGKPVDLVAERYRSRRLAGRNSDFEKAWTAWQRGRATCRLNPDSGKESAQNAWVLRFPTGKATSNFFTDLDAYWAACQKNIEAKKFLPIPGFIKFLGDISYLEAALGESSTTTNPEIEILKEWGDRQDWENFPLLAEWQAKCEELGHIKFTNLGGRWSPQHRFSDWLKKEAINA